MSDTKKYALKLFIYGYDKKEEDGLILKVFQKTDNLLTDVKTFIKEWLNGRGYKITDLNDITENYNNRYLFYNYYIFKIDEIIED